MTMKLGLTSGTPASGRRTTLDLGEPTTLTDATLMTVLVILMTTVMLEDSRLSRATPQDGAHLKNG